MDYEQQAGKNFAWLTMAQVGVRVLGMGFYLFLAYKLAAFGVGQYNFISSFVPFWFIVIDFGVGDYLYREWSKWREVREKAQRDFNILFTARLVMVLSVMVPFAIFNYFNNREIFSSLILFYFSMFVAMFLHLYDVYLQSGNLFKYTAIRQIIEKTVMVLSGVALLYFKASLVSVFVAILLSQIVSGLYYYGWVVTLKVRLLFDWQRSKQLFLRGLPFMLIAMLSSIYARVDMIMLRYMTDFEVVGWYGAAYKFLDVSNLFSVLFTASIFPILAQMYSIPEKKKQFNEFFIRAFRIIFSSGILIASGFIIFAPLFIILFFPDTFGPSILVLRILMLAQILMFLSILFNNLLLIQNKEKIGLRIIVISSFVNMILNFVLIPKFSLYGSAWATVFAEVCNLIMLQQATIWPKNVRILAKAFIVVALNVGVFGLLKFAGLTNNYFVGILFLLTNVLILWQNKLIQRDDLVLFLRPFRNKLIGFKESYL